jgi:transglutaminase-like putative cysteine protease
VKRRQVLAGILFISLIPAAALFGEAPSHSHEIESLKVQYLATKNPEQRKQFVSELKALAKNSSAGDAGAMNAAVSAMLEAADSAGDAEELLQIGATSSAGQNSAGQQASAPSLPQDSEFLVDARRAAEESVNANGDVEALADIRIDHLQKDSLGRDGLASAHVQKVWRINSVQGARSFSPRTVMYSGMNETLSMVRARVLKSDGREVEATVSADQPVVERGASMYFDSRSRDVRFSHLQPGDVVEIEYRLLPAAEVNPWAGYYARIDLFRDSLATRLRRRVLIAPSSMKLYAVERGLGPAVERQDGAETTRIWEARGIGAAADEFSPGASEAYLHVSTIGSMEEFGRWYSELLEPGLKLDENLRTMAQQILDRKLTTQGKVQAVYASVQRTKYTAFEFGVHSYQPYPVSTVERRGFGDCKDKAAMLVALLRAVGVQAEFAMVRTRSAGAVAEDAYSAQLFNHAMAFVPELNLYLDATADHAAVGELPLKDQGAMAMTVDAEGKATRRTVPYSSPQANHEIREMQAQLYTPAKIARAATEGSAGTAGNGAPKIEGLIAAARRDH